jgi:hypothetical protein
MTIKASKGLMAISWCLATLGASMALAAEQAPQASRQPPMEETIRAQRAWTAASEVEREHWRHTIAEAARPTRGCFRTAFPDTQWHPVPCDYSRRKLRLPNGGSGVRLETVGGTSGDMTAQVPGGITQALGSFDSVSTTGASDSLAGAGKYSLQINTEFFDTSVCSGSGAGSVCKGWEQFVFDEDGSSSMQYWLIDYGPPAYTCPAPHGASCDGIYVYTDGWCEFALYGRTYCATNSPVHSTSAAAPTALATVKVQGKAAVGAGSTDSLVASVGGAAVTVDGGNFFPDLATKWHEAEFNVFGAGNSSKVNFDANSTLVVRVGVDSGVNVGPGCDFHSFTAETNNLSIIDTTFTPLHNGHPSLVFTESNTGTPDPSCSAGVSIGDTHLTTFDGVHYDFQAAGEFLLAEVGKELTVQARQASGAPQWPNAAVNKAVALRMGKTRIAFYVEPARVEVNGATRAVENGQTLMLDDGVQLRRQGNVYTASDKHGNRVRATLNNNWLDAAVLVGHAPSQVRGLLGNPAGDGKSLATSAGARVPVTVTFNDFYGVFGSSWRVPPEQSLFGREGRINFSIPARPFYAQDLPQEAAARARAMCEREGVKDKELFEDCVLDTVVLNDKAAARAFVFRPTRLHTVFKPVFTEPAPCDKSCRRE